jgi:hypothetical protein
MNVNMVKEMFWLGSLLFNLKEKIVFYETHFNLQHFFLQLSTIANEEERQLQLRKCFTSLIKENVLNFQKKYTEIQTFISQRISNIVRDDLYQQIKVQEPKKTKESYYAKINTKSIDVPLEKVKDISFDEYYEKVYNLPVS